MTDPRQTDQRSSTAERRPRRHSRRRGRGGMRPGLLVLVMLVGALLATTIPVGPGAAAGPAGTTSGTAGTAGNVPQRLGFPFRPTIDYCDFASGNCDGDPPPGELWIRVIATGGTTFPLGAYVNDRISLQILMSISPNLVLDGDATLGTSVDGPCSLSASPVSAIVDVHGAGVCSLSFSITRDSQSDGVTYTLMTFERPAAPIAYDLPTSVAAGNRLTFWPNVNGDPIRPDITVSGPCTWVNRPPMLTSGFPSRVPDTFVTIDFGPGTGTCTITVALKQSIGIYRPATRVDTIEVTPAISTIRFVPGAGLPDSYGVNDPTGRVQVLAFTDLFGEILSYGARGCAMEQVTRTYDVSIRKPLLSFVLAFGPEYSTTGCTLEFVDTLLFEPGVEVPPQRFTIPAVSRAANTAPTAAIDVLSTARLPDAPFAFSGSRSADSQGPIRRYAWDFGNGATATGENASTTYTQAGTYDVRLTVTDEGGLSTTATTQVTVSSPTAPGAPTNVVVTPVRAGTVSVGFTPPTDDGGAAITSFRAVCSPTSSGIARSSSGATSPLVVSGLTAGARYQCRVNSTNAVGTGTGSPPSAAFVAVGAPAAPTGVTAVEAGSGRLSVGFTAPTADGGSPITAYVAVCSSTTGIARRVTGSTSPITVTSLTGGASYTCVAHAVNAAGTSTASSPSSPIVVRSVPSAPAGLDATITGPGRATVTVTPPTSDGGAPITSYRVVCTSPSGTARSASSSTGTVVITGLTAAAPYSCRASATNVIGTSFAAPAVAIPIAP